MAQTNLAPNSQSAGVAPEPLLGPAAARPTVNIAEYPRFMLLAHPSRWIVMGDAIVPSLYKMPIQPGVGGVDQKGNPRQAIAKRLDQGWIAIPEDIQGPGTSYIRRHDIPRGRVTYLLQWERVYLGSQQIGCDESGYTAFLQSLVASGLIPPCPVHVLERMQDQAQRAIGKYADRVSAVPSLAPRLARARRRLEVIEAALAERLEAARESAGAAPEPLPVLGADDAPSDALDPFSDDSAPAGRLATSARRGRPPKGA